MKKVKGCIINKKTAQVIGELLRSETNLKGTEIMLLARKFEEKCKTKRYNF